MEKFNQKGAIMIQGTRAIGLSSGGGGGGNGSGSGNGGGRANGGGGGNSLGIVNGMPHAMTLDGRKRLALSGVLLVESFNEAEITFKTSCGRLTVNGSGLSIELLEVSTGNALILGTVDGMRYRREREGFKALFK